ncbi:extracellular matrix-binding ebh [Babesia caballi]|uniref:Extracellular matrix-binding ebh n=1 Tax=Babesia caballi TaxID=5871 RepID=A0AAV4LTV4_BABCB|nr:extracellular matrix-binding ebh [Babesia caballi]
MSALAGGPNGLITKLADGLQKFIGYDAGSNGKITGGGILPANVARHQVCNAVLNFVIRFLEGLSKVNEASYKKVVDVIGKLRKCVGTGQVPEGFKELVGKIEGKVKQGFDTMINNARGKTKTIDVFEALKVLINDNLKFTNSQQNLNGETSGMENYIGEVSKKLEGDNSLHLSNLFNEFKTFFSQLRTKPLTLKDDEPLKLAVNGLDGKIKSLITAANDPGLNSDIRRSRTDKPYTSAVFSAVRDAATAFIADIKELIKYTSYYHDAEWSKVSSPDDKTKCAKIFLSCLPLYYQAFTYIYWGCDEKGGGWGNLTFDGSEGHHLKDFMFAMNYETSYLNNRRGSDVVGNAMKSFADFETAMNQAQTEAVKRVQAVTTARQRLYTGASADSNIKATYPEFLRELQKKFPETIKQLTSKEHTLAALYYCAVCYFKHQQSKNVTKAVKTPTTVREMLYYLVALPFSPNYDAFNTYVTEHFKKLSGESTAEYDATLMIPVADSGRSTEATERYGGNTLSAADIKDYLTSTCMYSMSALGWLQGPGASQKDDEPWLHELFCNSQFNLSYSSGQAILNTLSSCTYALQFQLGFLFSMCAHKGVKCGWQECRYGEQIEPKQTSKTFVSSHICHAGCNHTSGLSSQCKSHSGDKCGIGGQGSPLQAFLTDNLEGFRRGHPSETSDHLTTCSGQTCHVPMGLQATHLRQNAGTGNHIYSALYSFCGTSSSPLRQLSEKLGCLTKRTPRSLGDVFGFLWHLNGQLFKTRPKMDELIGKFDKALGINGSLSAQFTAAPYSVLTKIWNKIAELTSRRSTSVSPTASVLSRSLETMAPAIPFLYRLFMAEDSNSLPGTLFDLNQHCHKKAQDGNITHTASTTGHRCTTSPNDLWSLLQPVRSTGNNNSDCSRKNCGGYLSPLTHSSGATYAPVHASVYLSWLAYLTDDFHEWFQNLLDEFQNIDCSKTGCRGSTSGKDACISKHPPGTHGTSNQLCQCDSVVHCGGVLPLLYRYGFQFYSPHTLSGGSKGDDQTKRNCHKFHSALSNVLAESAPLTKLLASIDDFLYAIRWEFFSKLSAFWTIYICVILYTLFFLLDTLHLRSHLKLTVSHVVPPLALLTSGKPLPVTKLTYIGQ